MDVSSSILILDTSVCSKDNIGQKEYESWSLGIKKLLKDIKRHTKG
jgi:hypothetical protein